jgi:hypothetical protein
MLNKIFAKLPGRVDADEFAVSFDHAACSYGNPVLILRGTSKRQHADFSNTAFGPADLGKIQVSKNHPSYNALIAAGFACVDDINVDR